MLPDKDRPSTWVPHRESQCNSCAAVCCTMPVEVTRDDLTRLGLAVDEVSDKRAFQRLRREGFVRSYRASTGLFLFEQTVDGRCKFLGKDFRCTVYEKRPGTCRDFPLRVGTRVGYCPYGKPRSARPAR
jgi:Fe-S-cluster containining protein